MVNPENNNEIWVAAVGHLYSPNAERGVFKPMMVVKLEKRFRLTKTGVIDLS